MLETQKQTQTEAIQIVASPVLTDTQATALDLYERGFNVFPLPSVHEWRTRKEFEKHPNKKPPYMLETLFYSRLHLCTPNCRHSRIPVFVDLFARANIGVMCGKTSGNSLGIDCDSQAAYKKVHLELEARSIPYWAITSHRGGVYLVRVIEGEAANMEESKIKDAQVWGNHQYVVLPPSIHPQGTIYQWATPEPRYSLPDGVTIPAVSVSALDWLGVTLKKGKEFDLLGLPEWTKVLTQKDRETLAHGAPEGQRNKKLSSVAYNMAGNGIAYDVAEQALILAANRCQPPEEEKAASDIIRSAYKQTRTSSSDYHGERKTASNWELAANFANTYDWRKAYGRKGNKLQNLYLALVERAKLDGGEKFRASLRELADLAGTSFSRASVRLQTLIADKLVSFAGTTSTGANTYSFPTIPVVITIPPLLILLSGREYSDEQKDVFARLGDNAFRLWKYLLTSPSRTPYAMSKALQIPPSSTYAAVKSLLACGLASYSKAEGMYYGESKTNSTLGELAVDLGTNGKAIARRAKHKQEREIRNNNLMADARDNYK